MSTNTDLPKVTFHEAQEILLWALDAEVSVMIYGPPGIGKTAIPRAAAAARGVPFVAINAPQLDSVDLRGVPFVTMKGEHGETHWAAPWFMRHPSPNGLLALDEITSCLPSVTVASMQLLLEKRIGDAALQPGWQVVAMGNTASDNTIAYELPAPARNRMLQFELTVDVGLWMRWAGEAKLHPDLINFLTDNPAFLAGKINVLATAFPTPRAWELLSRVMYKAPRERISKIAEGLVGREAAAHLHQFLQKGRQASLSPEAIRASPKQVIIPSSSDLPGVLQALAATASSKVIMNDITFLARLNKESQAAFVSMLPASLQKDYSDWLSIAK